MASDAADAIQWSDVGVKTAFNNHIRNATQGIDVIESIIASLGAIASNLNTEECKDQVDPLIEATQRMLQAHHQLSNHREALKDLKQTYRPTGDPTDFQAEIDERVSRLAQANPYNVAVDEQFQMFMRDIGGPSGGTQQIDDDIAIEGGGVWGDIAKNARCPYTLKALLDIVEPVQDAYGFVYEKVAVMGDLKKNNNRVRCAVAGTAHYVTAKELHPARAVLAEKKKAATGRGRLRATQVQDEGEFLDLDELE